MLSYLGKAVLGTMSWDRSTSNAEQLMVQILQQAGEPLTLDEIVARMLEMDPTALTGKTPKKSLYSVIVRREKRRVTKGHEPLFNKTVRGGAIYYRVNPSGRTDLAGKKIASE